MDAVLFDLDQTLPDREAFLLKFLNWQSRGMLAGCLEDADRFVARFVELDAGGTVWKDKVYEALISEFKISTWSVEELLSVYRREFGQFAIPMSGAAEAVAALSGEGLALGLVSNGRSPFQERNFQALGFADQFKVVVVSEAVGMRKPGREIFELACRQLNVSVSLSVFVGDNPGADIRGAKTAGLRTVFVPSARYRECEEADAVCADLATLPAILRDLACRG